MSSHAAAGLSVSASTTNFFHHSLSDTGQQPLHVHKAKTDPCAPFNPHTSSFFLRGFFPGERAAPGVRCIRRVWASSSPFPHEARNLWAICCYLGNVLRTLHGHICTRALTSLLFLGAGRHWRLLWWCHAGFLNKSDCLSWVTLPARFLCRVCLCACICQTGFFLRPGTCFVHLWLYCDVGQFSK